MPSLMIPPPFPPFVLDAIPDGVVVSWNNAIVQVNQALCALSGYQETFLLGKNLRQTLFPALNLPTAMAENRPAGNAVAFRTHMTRADGSSLSVSINNNLVEKGDETPMTITTVRDILKVVEQEHRLRDSEQQYRAIFENAQEGIYQTTPNGTYVNVNAALARIYGYETPEQLIAGLTDIAGQLYVNHHDRDAFKEIMEARGVVRDFEAQIRRRDGEVIWITENARCVRDAAGQVRYYEGTVEDITQRKEAEENIRLLAKAFESVAEGIALLDRRGIVQAANPAFTAVTGFSAGKLCGAALALVAEGLHEKGFLENALRQVEETGHWQGEVFAARNGGDPFPGDCTISAVRDDQGEITHFVVTLLDISRRKQDEEHIRFHANFDTLTRLPNRRLVIDRIEQALLRSQRSGSRAAILFLDLDRFKQINDTLGHAAGDELLRLVARRLKHCVRMSDTVGRIGGDEFVILLPDCGPGNPGTYTAEKVLYSLSEPFTLTGNEQFCIPSIGIAYFPDHGLTVGELLRHADVAMYHAKQGGEQRYAVFDAAMTARLQDQASLETDLRMALARNELELHYQPKVCSRTLKPLGAEALIRWRHPRLGLVSPVRFIPLAEETGLILAIGRWVLRQACMDMVDWLRQGIAPPGVSVNVSPRQFSDPAFAGTVSQIIEQSGLPPAMLDLEITESVMSGDVERAVSILQQLKAMGVTLSMDDFGTGYSSLNYLKTFPIDTLKIDQTFIRDVTNTPRDAAIVSTIITLAQNLGFSVVAEGVETEGHARFLQEKGCDTLQGYWIARPLPRLAFEGFMRRKADSDGEA